MSAMEEGFAAKRLLENPLLKAALEEMKRETFENWGRTPSRPQYDEELRRLHLFGEVISLFESTLTARVQAMDKQLFDEEQRKK